jgi:hypothetical protein
MSDDPHSVKLASTERSQLRRRPERGSSEREVVNAILDEALVAHVGFIYDSAPNSNPCDALANWGLALPAWRC